MKKIILGAVALLCLASCSYRVYPVSTLNDNYNLAMQTPEEIAARDNVAIFLSENEVPGPYKLIAFVENRPVLPVAVASQQLKNFYKQAVLKADELGGNAIIVNSIRSFKVIRLPEETLRKLRPGMKAKPATPAVKPVSEAKPTPAASPDPAPKAARPAPQTRERTASAIRTRENETQRPPRQREVDPLSKLVGKVKDAEIFKKKEVEAVVDAAPADPDSPIFDESTVQWFTSGYVYRAKEQEQIEIINAMNNEIRDNLKICKTRSEADCILKKIELLEKYNQALPIPSGTQANKIKAYRNTIKKLTAKL
ncbi:MAG: membrane lipoprotein lipid attachment site-containing protein [Bacteroidales bacterium]|nr:membrane lipoprotein lipid attachment site-containing protein [Bacteroidales bacterium]